ncbi:MAG: hypothetical protein HYY87_01760 [Candidatus Levybacteria bacterium]|nr:hypothetical protein [Candidatus Levybacteria bacterium]
MGRVFIEAFGSSKDVATKFAPPLIGNPADTSAFGALIGLGIILMTPSIVDLMKQVFKAPKLDVSTVGKAVGAGTGAGKGIVSTTALGAFGISKPGDKGIGAVLRRFVGI